MFRFILVDDIEGPVTPIGIENLQGTLCCYIVVSSGNCCDGGGEGGGGGGGRLIEIYCLIPKFKVTTLKRILS